MVTQTNKLATREIILNYNRFLHGFYIENPRSHQEALRLAKRAIDFSKGWGNPKVGNDLILLARNYIRLARKLYRELTEEVRNCVKFATGSYIKEKNLWRATLRVDSHPKLLFWSSHQMYKHRQSAQRAAQKVLAKFLDTGELPTL